MVDILESVLRIVVWTGIIAFTWNVSSSLAKIASALDKSDVPEKV